MIARRHTHTVGAVKRKGFTIIQLVIGMLIFAILTGIAFFGISIYTAQANETRVASDLGTFEVAIKDYMLNNTGACSDGTLNPVGLNHYLTKENALALDEADPNKDDLGSEISVAAGVKSEAAYKKLSVLEDPWGHQYRVVIRNNADRTTEEGEYGAKGTDRAFIYVYSMGKDGKGAANDTKQDDSVLCVQYSDGEVYSRSYLPSDGKNQTVAAPAYTYWNKDANGKHSVMKDSIFAVGGVDPDKAPEKEDGAGGSGNTGGEGSSGGGATSSNTATSNPADTSEYTSSISSVSLETLDKIADAISRSPDIDYRSTDAYVEVDGVKYKVSIGNTRIFKFGDTNYSCMIMGFNHYDKADGSGKAGLLFQTVKCLNMRAYWPSGNGVSPSKGTMSIISTGSAKNTNWTGINNTVHNALRGEVLDSMDAKDVIKMVTIETVVGEYNNIFGNADWYIGKSSEGLFIPSEFEVFGFYGKHSITAEGNQYAAYANGESRKKGIEGSGGYANWWMRSAKTWSSFYTYICFVNTAGNSDFTFSSNDNGIAPCFCI